MAAPKLFATTRNVPQLKIARTAVSSMGFPIPTPPRRPLRALCLILLTKGENPVSVYQNPASKGQIRTNPTARLLAIISFASPRTANTRIKQPAFPPRSVRLPGTALCVDRLRPGRPRRWLARPASERAVLQTKALPRSRELAIG
jgi:hypothetical protein